MSWDDILGQDGAMRILRAHLTEDRVASAYLLAGPEGVGKRQLAMELAKALNCAAEGSRPCGACRSCLQTAKGTHPDVHVIVTSGPSEQIKIDDVRHLLGRIVLRPFSGRAQVAILDGAERMTEEAANALLKMLEEPPRHAHFFLITARLSACLSTIISRCQLISCRRLGGAAIQRLLAERHGADATTAAAVARLSGGSASQAIGLLGRWGAYREVLRRCAETTPTSWIESPLPQTREEVGWLLEGMVGWLRDLAIVASDGRRAEAHPDDAETLSRQAATVDLDRCVDTAMELIQLRESLGQFVSPRLVAALAREKWLSLASDRRQETSNR